MRYWLCYHNVDERGRLPGDHQHDIDPTQFAEDGDTRGASPCGIYTEKETVRDAIGDTVFLIVGVGQSPKKFFLWSWFVIDDVREASDGSFEAFGEQGSVLNPAPSLDGEDFEAFKRRVGNFAFGFQNITDCAYTKTIRRLIP